MNKYQQQIIEARRKYPLKKTLLLNPMIGIMRNGIGEEYVESAIRNQSIVDSFLIELKDAHREEAKLFLGNNITTDNSKVNKNLIEENNKLKEALEIYLNAGSKEQRKEASIIAKKLLHK